MTIYTPSQADKKPDKDAVEPEVVTEPLTGDKDKEAAAAAANELRVIYFRAKRRSAFMHMLLAIIILAVLALGAIGSVVLYRHLHKKSDEVYTMICGNMFYDDTFHDYMDPNIPEYGSEHEVEIDFVEEDMVVSVEKRYEEIHTPEFDEVRESFILHDFPVNLTAIIDHDMERCFVTALRKEIAPPPSLVIQVKDVMDNGIRIKTVVIHQDYNMMPFLGPHLLPPSSRIMEKCADYELFWLEFFVSGVMKRSEHSKSIQRQNTGKLVGTYAMFTNQISNQVLYKMRVFEPHQE